MASLVLSVTATTDCLLKLGAIGDSTLSRKQRLPHGLPRDNGSNEAHPRFVFPVRMASSNFDCADY